MRGAQVRANMRRICGVMCGIYVCNRRRITNSAPQGFDLAV
ncbi:hypothetical protein [Kordiimonas sp.]